MRPAEGEQASGAALWAEAVCDESLRAGVEVVVCVPDKKLEPILLGFRQRRLPIRCLTREEECIGFAAGFICAGGRPLVMMQTSGLGNALNALGSLVIPYRLGVPIVISMRGTLGETNPSQMPLGRATPELLNVLGIQTFAPFTADQLAHTMRSVFGMCFEGDATVAVMLDGALVASEAGGAVE